MPRALAPVVKQRATGAPQPTKPKSGGPLAGLAGPKTICTAEGVVGVGQSRRPR